MKIIEQSHQILPEIDDLVKQLEERGRICYQSQDKITAESAPKFAARIIKNGHNSVLEMAVICIEGEIPDPIKYMQVTNGITSASVKAWREFLIKRSINVPLQLHSRMSVLFEDIINKDKNNGSLCFMSFNIIPMPTNDLNHTYVCVKFITNRAMTHEIVRHRPCSFLQESQRYVKYDRPEGIEFIKPVEFDDWSKYQQNIFESSCIFSESHYSLRRLSGQTPQQARGSLINDTKTEILVYCNLREWRHIFFQRTQGGADPQMKALMRPVLEEFRERFPGHFDVLKPSVG